MMSLGLNHFLLIFFHELIWYFALLVILHFVQDNVVRYKSSLPNPHHIPACIDMTLSD